MKKWKQRGFAFVLALSLTTGMLTGAQAAVSKETLNEAVQDTAEYMYRTVQTPQVGSIGGEWAVLGLARSGYDVPDSYYQDYYATVEAYVTACDGKLHDKKYTEYSRVIVALSSIGKDARNVAGYDLTKPLGDYEKTIWQGLNGPIWALIALAIPCRRTRRQMYRRPVKCISTAFWSASCPMEGGACSEEQRQPVLAMEYPIQTSPVWLCRHWPSIKISRR